MLLIKRSIQLGTDPRLLASCKNGGDYANGKRSQGSRKATKGVFDAIAAAIQEGKTLGEINVMKPGFFMQNKAKIEAYKEWWDLSQYKPQKEWKGIQPLGDGEDRVGVHQLHKWVVENVKVRRKWKQKQLYLWGPRDVGKSTFANMLSKRLRAWIVPSEDWECTYENGKYDICIMDEFCGQKTVQWLNTFLQGGLCPLKRKGSSSFVKEDNPPVVMLSNVSPRDCYKNVVQVRLEALESRLEIIYIGSPFKIKAC